MSNQPDKHCKPDLSALFTPGKRDSKTYSYIMEVVIYFLFKYLKSKEVVLYVKQAHDLSKTLFFLGGSEQGVSKELPVLSSNITSAFHLNNSHLHLMVHWAGKNNPIVFVLSRDQDLTKDNPTSNFYISKDYGRTFTDVSSKFQLSSGKNATLEKFYNHPESPCYYVVTDTIEKVRNY